MREVPFYRVRVTGLDYGDAALMSLNLWIKEHLSKFDLDKLLLRPSFALALSKYSGSEE